MVIFFLNFLSSFKVVKVWFQNSRARDRREGKPVLHPSGGHLPTGFFNNGPDGNSFPGNGNGPIGLAASGLFPRLPLLGPLMNGGHTFDVGLHNKNSMSPRSEAKSPYSTASDSEAGPTKPAGESFFSCIFLFFKVVDMRFYLRQQSILGWPNQLGGKPKDWCMPFEPLEPGE